MKTGASPEFIARYRASDGKPQYLKDHLECASVLTTTFTEKIGLPSIGALMGLLHDFGKYSNAFQSYIKSSRGKIEPAEDKYVEAGRLRGKIDHSTAGAQYIWEDGGKSPFRRIAKEIIALCIASHHSGLIDCLAPDGNDVMSKRMAKPKEQTHIDEVKSNIDDFIKKRISPLFASASIEDELRRRFELLLLPRQSQEIRQFMLGFLTRFLFSTLTDADRLNSAEREPAPKPALPLLIEKLEGHLATLVLRRVDGRQPTSPPHISATALFVQL